ncbi:MAG: DJ-1/PfpI family protein [Sedimentisphaerales bacterium]|jgi:4-methyl-5(b-hydroxyethyl)-thiazole monophosphate biosynthesis|nr:DJ-1/PfpI family protein [Sedimentisphaerales bacterium]
MSKKVLVAIADGIEEIEAVCIIDTLRRAQVQVTVASAGNLQVTASRGVKIVADTTIQASAGQVFDMIAIPGGMAGTEALARCDALTQMLKAQAQAGRWIAAICAAPAVVLQPLGLLKGIKATCYPSLQDRLVDAYVSREPVVVDKNIVTGQGPALAIDFALKLVEILVGLEKRKEVAAGMLARG